MPTGYTAKIKDGINFTDFVLNCSRAFGALIMMRGEPDNAPIPDEFQPSDYHVNELTKLGERKKELMKMALIDGAAKTARDAAYQESISYWQNQESEKTDLRNKYNEMLAKVKQWEPPTSEHIGLKTFMIQQITDSIDWDCRPSEKPKKVSVEEWYNNECERVQREVEYHTKENQAEISRAQERSNWVKELKKSLNSNFVTA